MAAQPGDAPVGLWADTLLKDNPLLINKIIDNVPGASKKNIKLGVSETLKFLYLCRIAAPKPLTPSKKIDDIWHEFILFTRTYMEFCEQELGQFIHHQPSLSPHLEAQQYSRTLDLYRQYFGQPNQVYWCASDTQALNEGTSQSTNASCGTCEN